MANTIPAFDPLYKEKSKLKGIKDINIVAPFAVGDMVYFLDEDKVRQGKVKKISIEINLSNEEPDVFIEVESFRTYTSHQKKFFASKEDLINSL